MLLNQLDKVIVAFTILAIPSAMSWGPFGKKQKPPAAPITNAVVPTTAPAAAPTVAAVPPIDGSITGADPFNTPKPNLPPGDPTSDLLMQIFDVLGVTKRAKQQISRIDIPMDLTGKSDEELMTYALLLMKQRRKLQRKMSRYMAYTALTMLILQLSGSKDNHKVNNLAKGGAAGVFWLNNSFRDTINADWLVHQQQLALFIHEYSRIKNVNLKALPKSRIVGAPVLRLEHKKDHFLQFPVWTTERGQQLPRAVDIRTMSTLVRNWYMK